MTPPLAPPARHTVLQARPHLDHVASANKTHGMLSVGLLPTPGASACQACPTSNSSTACCTFPCKNTLHARNSPVSQPLAHGETIMTNSAHHRDSNPKSQRCLAAVSWHHVPTSVGHLGHTHPSPRSHPHATYHANTSICALLSSRSHDVAVSLPGPPNSASV